MVKGLKRVSLGEPLKELRASDWGRVEHRQEGAHGHINALEILEEL